MSSLHLAGSMPFIFLPPKYSRKATTVCEARAGRVKNPKIPTVINNSETVSLDVVDVTILGWKQIA